MSYIDSRASWSSATVAIKNDFRSLPKIAARLHTVIDSAKREYMCDTVRYNPKNGYIELCRYVEVVDATNNPKLETHIEERPFIYIWTEKYE